MEYLQENVEVVIAALAAFSLWLLKSIISKALDHYAFIKSENLKREIFMRDQAAIVAEYLSLAWRLDRSDDRLIYQKVNMLAWQLALYLPDDVYKHVTGAVANPSQQANIGTAIVAVRTLLRGEAGPTLSPDDIPCHLPDIGRGRS